MSTIEALAAAAEVNRWDYVITRAGNIIEGVVSDILRDPGSGTLYNLEHSNQLHDFLLMGVCEAFELEIEGGLWAVPIGWWYEREVVALIKETVAHRLVVWEEDQTELLRTIVNPTFWSACVIRLDGNDPPTQVYLDYRRDVLCILGRLTTPELTTDQQRATAEAVCARHLDVYITLLLVRDLQVT
jgi:hypothetical protein